MITRWVNIEPTNLWIRQLQSLLQCRACLLYDSLQKALFFRKPRDWGNLLAMLLCMMNNVGEVSEKPKSPVTSLASYRFWRLSIITPRSFGFLRVNERSFSQLTLVRWVLFRQKSYLVDPASSHMLVSKIKPCMSKYKQLYTVKLRTAHYISNYLFDGFLLHG